MGAGEKAVVFVPAEDATQLAELNRAIQDMHYRLYPEEFRPWEREPVEAFFAEALGWDSHHFFIIYNAGAAVGYIWYELRQRRDHPFKLDTNILFLHQISVNPDMQGRGIGRHAMGFVEERARGAGADRIKLDYWEGNPAGGFYKKMGFRTVNRVVVKELHG